MKWVRLLICVVAGLVLLLAGLLIPAHIRAVDAVVLQCAGENTSGLLAAGQALANTHHLGAAQMILQAMLVAGLPGTNRLADAVDNAARQNPSASLFWGNDLVAAGIFGTNYSAGSAPASLTVFMVNSSARAAALAHLSESRLPAVQELLRCRSLDHTVIFPSSRTSAGQAFDTAVAVCGLLLDENRLSENLSENIYLLASRANNNVGSSRPLEQALLDFMSLGERFNWDQMTVFVAQIQDPATLDQLTADARTAGNHLPVEFASVQLSGNPAGVAKYLAADGPAGWPDLTAVLRHGSGGVGELVKQPWRYYHSTGYALVVALDPFAVILHSTGNFTYHHPAMALTVKCFCYLMAGFFVVLALAGMNRNPRPQAYQVPSPGLALLRGLLFSAGFLLVILLLSEPFLAPENQGGNFSLRPHLPMVGGAATAGAAAVRPDNNIMNPTILLTLLIFFVLQALIYVLCIAKLAEIRRQNLLPRTKLKLLENEDHLFDAGLYLGFVGTIVSLIVASLGLVKFSLMAAYSSTSFGIIFVVIFKIFHLRPVRRKLLLEVEAAEAPAEPAAPALTTAAISS